MFVILWALHELLTQWVFDISHIFDQLLFHHVLLIVLFDTAATLLFTATVLVSVLLLMKMEHLDGIPLRDLAQLIEVVIHIEQWVFRLQLKKFLLYFGMFSLLTVLNDELGLVSFWVLFLLSEIQKFERHLRINEFTLFAAVLQHLLNHVYFRINAL